MMDAKRTIVAAALAVMATIGGCSRSDHDADRVLEAATTTGAEPDAAAPEISPAPPAFPRTPGAHVVFLPYETLGDTPSPVLTIAPGEPPGSVFSAGTVYVARAERDGEYVTEWDLARGTIRRTQKLDVPMEDGNLRMRRIGDVLHVVAWAFNGDVRYLRLTLRLEQKLTQPLGDVSASGPGAIVGDAAWTLILVDGIPLGMPRTGADAGGYFAFSFDAAGRPVARRKLPAAAPADSPQANAVVVSGHAFVALESSHANAIRLVVLGRALDIERDGRVEAPPSVAWTRDLKPSSRPPRVEPPQGTFDALFGWHDRFYATWTNPRSTTAFAASGQRIGPVTPCDSGDATPDDDDLWLSDEHVALRATRVDQWLEWTDPGTEPAPRPPCPGAP
jgi:hypothetical protein